MLAHLHTGLVSCMPLLRNHALLSAHSYRVYKSGAHAGLLDLLNLEFILHTVLHTWPPFGTWRQLIKHKLN